MWYIEILIAGVFLEFWGQNNRDSMFGACLKCPQAICLRQLMGGQRPRLPRGLENFGPDEGCEEKSQAACPDESESQGSPANQNPPLRGLLWWVEDDFSLWGGWSVPGTFEKCASKWVQSSFECCSVKVLNEILSSQATSSKSLMRLKSIKMRSILPLKHAILTWNPMMFRIWTSDIIMNQIRTRIIAILFSFFPLKSIKMLSTFASKQVIVKRNPLSRGQWTASLCSSLIVILEGSYLIIVIVISSEYIEEMHYFWRDCMIKSIANCSHRGKCVNFSLTRKNDIAYYESDRLSFRSFWAFSNES